MLTRRYISCPIPTQQPTKPSWEGDLDLGVLEREYVEDADESHMKNAGTWEMPKWLRNIIEWEREFANLQRQIPNAMEGL
ncbi:hypothetical protein EV2_018539 [Malus domestica]